ncbi:hypothetical protein ACJJTC_017597 [Scirpophaga incertulas]
MQRRLRIVCARAYWLEASGRVPLSPLRPVFPATRVGGLQTGRRDAHSSDSSNWVVFQPDYIIDARLGCLWQIHLVPSGLAHSIPKDEISKIVAVLLRRKDAEETVYRILNQLVSNAATYLVELTKVFDEINSIYRKWAEIEIARNTAGQPAEPRLTNAFRVLIGQREMCERVFTPQRDHAQAVSNVRRARPLTPLTLLNIHSTNSASVRNVGASNG